jgi:uncharacterized protein
MAMPFPGKLRGRPAFDLAREALGDNGIRRAVGIAAMNALAGTCWRRRPHPETELRLGINAFDATEIRPGDTVVVVGAFVPFLRELKRRRQPFLVLEQDPATLKPEELPFFRPAEQAATVVPEADVLLITGTTLINDTLEELLALAKPTARVTMVGPTVSLLPDAFLHRGADVLGTVRITEVLGFVLALWPTQHNCARTDNSAGCAHSGHRNRPSSVVYAPGWRGPYRRRRAPPKPPTSKTVMISVVTPKEGCSSRN